MIEKQKSIIAKFSGNKVFLYLAKVVTFAKIYFSSIGQNLLNIFILKIYTNKYAIVFVQKICAIRLIWFYYKDLEN